MTSPPQPPSRGFWSEAIRQFLKRRIAVLALCYVLLLGLIGLSAPLIIGAKPIVCKFQGNIYFPCLAYFNPRWEPGVFSMPGFRKQYSTNLRKFDEKSWALWPLFYQDIGRRVREKEWPGQPANPSGNKGAPNRFNICGTDQQGHDVLAQLIHGTTTSLMIGFVATGIAASIGIFLGAIAGYCGGWIDLIISRIIEIVLSIPTLILILAISAYIDKRTIWHIMVILGCTSWPSIARLTRAEFLKLKQSDFVMAARALGAGPIRIVFRHILPNALAPILVPVTFNIASAILTESALSFLGLGAPPPTPSWGRLLDAGQKNYEMWWLLFFPGFAVFSTVFAYNLIGDGLQQALDPRLREAGK